jgi:hypothetical protein
MPHFLLVASTTINSKSQTRVECGFSWSYREKFSLTPVHFFLAGTGRRRPRSDNRWLRDMAPCFVAGIIRGASVSNQRAFAWLRSAEPWGWGPASAGSDCRSRGCPQSPAAHTSRRVAGYNSRTWPLRRSPSARTKASRRLGRHAGVRSIAAAAAITMEDRKTRKFFSIDWRLPTGDSQAIGKIAKNWLRFARSTQL